MLESVTNPNRINIKDLVLEEPGEKFVVLPFDAEKEITQLEWDQAINSLQDYRDRNQWMYYARLAAPMKLVFPSRVSELNLDDEVVTGINERLDEFKVKDKRKAGMFGLSIWFFKSVAILFPNGDWRRDEDWIKESWPKNRNNDISLHEALVVTFPEERPKIDLSLLQGDLDRLKQYLRSSDYEYRTSYIRDAAKFRVLFQKQNLFNLDLGRWAVAKEDWKDIQRSTISSRDIEFMETAAALKILAAQEVKVSKEGMEIIMYDPSFQPPNPSLPEIRRF